MDCYAICHGLFLTEGLNLHFLLLRWQAGATWEAPI